VFRSEEGAANAVVSGKVDAAFVGQDIASSYDLSFEAADRISLDVLVAEDRRKKGSVVSFIEGLQDTGIHGYRVPEDTGDTVEHWDQT
jgi:molybdate-binding protein